MLLCLFSIIDIMRSLILYVDYVIIWRIAILVVSLLCMLNTLLEFVNMASAGSKVTKVLFIY